MSRSLYIEPREPEERPVIHNHREWCQWLLSRGSLSPRHRPCLRASRCVAIDGSAVHASGSWEGRRVSR